MQYNQPQWLDRKEYPFRSHYLDIDGQALHYVDEGEGDTLLFIHGTPSWSFDWRHLIRQFSKNYRCVAPDHIGFGLSAKPARYDYTTLKHGGNLGLLIRHLGLKNITLVMHDFGGPIGFHYAMEHPSNIKQFIVLNSWLWDFSDMPAFRSLAKLLKSPLIPFLYKRLNFSAAYLLPKSFARKPDRKILKHYTSPFRKASERMGCLAFAYSLLNDGHWLETMWSQRPVLQDKKMLLAWGMCDKFVTPEFLHRFAEGFPLSRVVEFENCGHFPQEEVPAQLIDVVQRFLDGPGVIHYEERSILHE